MALSDVLKRYGETGATEGIMVPSANVQSITTEQEVYDSATDGIMTINNEQYIGPNATVTYGGEDTAYNRMLREIEQGELPQFDQSTFPAVGTGIMESSTPVTQPVDTTPVTQEQEFDPCPPGYKLINGVCQLVNPQQDAGRGGGGQTFTGPKVSSTGKIDGYTHVLDRAAGSGGTLNSMKMQQIEDEYGLGIAKKVGEVNQKYRNRGVQLKAIDKAEYDRVMSVYGQERIDKDYTLGKDGKYYRIVATSPTMGELVEDAAIAAGDILENANMINIVQNALGDKDDEVVEPPKPEEGSTIVTRTAEGPIQEETTEKDTKTDRPEPTEVPTLTERVPFGELPQVQEFGQLVRDNFTAQLEIDVAKDVIEQYETLYKTGRITFGERDSELDRQKDLIEKAKKKKQETEEKMEESDIGDIIPRQEYSNKDTAQERLFKQKLEEKRIKNEVKKFQKKQEESKTKQDKARTGERLTLRL